MCTQTMKTSCPSATILRRFLDDGLTAAEADPLQRHVDACPACLETLARLVGPAPEPIGALSGADSGADRTLHATEPATREASASSVHVPGYELLGELGRGGMGVVYKARQLRPDRVVALKMLLTGVHAGGAERVRFLREAEAVASLQHPYIVQLYEASQHGELPYLTLEYVSGGTLADLLRQKPLSPGAAARLVEQLARAVQCAHERGIVHRDLKPANVLLQFADLGLRMDEITAVAGAAPVATPVSADLQNAIPKITDFGLAKNMGGSVLTASNAVCGTPSYMAPEQAAGPAKDIGPAVDVYALGAILYQCLTSRPPFLGPTPADTLLQVVSEEPAPPSHLQFGVPRDLETICLKCLQKKPEQRYASAQELAEDLRRFQAGDAIRARPVGRWERVVKWCRRRPAVAALCSAVVVLTLLGAGLVTWQWREAVTALAEARSEKAARAERQVAALPDAAAASVPAILEDLESSRKDVFPLLCQRYHDEKDRLRRMRLALALAPVEPETVRGPLLDWLLAAEDPAEVLLARKALEPSQDALTADLWAKAEDSRAPGSVRLRAFVALAAYDPHNSRWQKLGPQVVEYLLWANPLHQGTWMEALRPLGPTLAAPFTESSYFPMKVGSKWHYRAETSEGKVVHAVARIGKVEKIDGQMLARWEALVNGEMIASEHFSCTAKGIFRHRNNGADVTPPMRLLSFPVQIGETWEGEHKNGEQLSKVIGRTGYEEVEVPAGKFKAVTVHLQVETDGKMSTVTFWFAAGVGIVKEEVQDGATVTMELERFEEGR
ncbi:MAG: serine/threonine-protein kinase [Gemmataceae bacterium]